MHWMAESLEELQAGEWPLAQVPLEAHQEQCAAQARQAPVVQVHPAGSPGSEHPAGPPGSDPLAAQALQLAAQVRQAPLLQVHSLAAEALQEGAGTAACSAA